MRKFKAVSSVVRVWITGTFSAAKVWKAALAVSRCMARVLASQAEAIVDR